MLKQIETTELHLGMYIAKISEKWFESPFWRPSFLLTKDKDIQTLLDHGFTSVWIDTSKGLDPDEIANGPETEAESAASASGRAAEAPSAQSANPDIETRSRAESYGFGDPLPVAPNEPRPAPLETERARAAAICGKARRAMVEMFQELRMGQAVDAERMLPVVDEISQSVLRNSDALLGLVRLKTKNDYTYMHSVAVCALMVALARQLGMPEDEVRDAGLAGLLHDIGKMAVPNGILDKPGTLTDEEFRVIKSHPVAGHRILSKGSGVPASALDVVLHHHEKIDGSGYPHGLADAQISRLARMGAVCDVYDALTSNRPYKEGWCPTKAIRLMATWKGHFDAAVFQAFVKSVGIYPVGTLVRLESGRLGVVLQQLGRSLLQPRVRVFFSTKSMTHIPPEVVDLGVPHARDKIVDWEDPEKWEFKNLENLWVHG
ncbi:HD-GYP domain-containing protein [Noviherbaspirillum pedocola]|uniref:HD-GYP domain-containing protein n=1 Tax=Noviherbaspirillum pedocola TaxID=2801341 RepID=A0A934T2W5_9BURK|nr:HD-GYP domain-containing protein [Noviherbaspirillum pedocola]MBK4738344.1 HD-GYP domain-containing protein [Noviherbaspirillum pedocola]